MSNKLSLNDIAYCNGLAVRKLSRKVTQLYDTAVAPTGLRSTQIHILGELYHQRKNPPTLNQLADALVVDRSGLGHNLRPLERDGYVEIVENPHDRRERNLILTDAGKEKLLECLPLWKKAQDSFDELYGAEKMRQFREFLSMIAYDENLL